MSVIRFAHIDHLRLGSPLSGIADCPVWLRHAAANAVRESVARVIHQSIAEESRFLLIAGRLTECPELSPVVLAWLHDQMAATAGCGFSFLICCAEQDRALWAKLPNVTCFSRSEAVRVIPVSDGGVRFEVGSRFEPADSPRFLIRVDQGSVTAAPSDLAYVAVPSQRLDGRHVRHSVRGVFVNSAGSPQAIHPSEGGLYGGQVIDVDLTNGTMTSRFQSSCVVRYEQFQVALKGCRDRESAVSAFAQTAQVDPSGPTVIADWDVADWGGLVGSVGGPELLEALRTRYGYGHCGLWPRRLRFSSVESPEVLIEDSRLADLTPAIRRHSVVRNDRDEFPGLTGWPGGSRSEAESHCDRLRIMAEFLRRVA